MLQLRARCRRAGGLFLSDSPGGERGRSSGLEAAARRRGASEAAARRRGASWGLPRPGRGAGLSHAAARRLREASARQS